MSTNTQKKITKNSAQFPFWKTKKFKNKKKKSKKLKIVKNVFSPDDEDKAIAQGMLLNEKRLSFLANSDCNELVRDLMRNPHLSSQDRLAVIEHLTKASLKIFPLVEKIALVKYSFEVQFFNQKEKRQVREILTKLQLLQTQRAISILEDRLSAFKLGGDFFDANIYAQSIEIINQIRASRIFDAEIAGIENRYIFWKISPSFIYAKLQQPKTHGIYKHHNEITDIRLKPVIKIREWLELENEFGINFRSNPVEYTEVLKLRVDNRGEPEVVLYLLRKLNLLTSNFERYLVDAQAILERVAIEAEEARKKREEFQKLALERAKQQKIKIREAERNLDKFIRDILAKNKDKPVSIQKIKVVKPEIDRTHRDRSVDGARENWHRICPHCRQTYPFYSSCDCR